MIGVEIMLSLPSFFISAKSLFGQIEGDVGVAALHQRAPVAGRTGWCARSRA